MVTTALRVLLTICAFAAAYVAFGFYLEARGRMAEIPDEPFDAIVVLGCRVAPDGRPSPSLSRRARHAARLYGEGRAPWVVTTGGFGEFGAAEGEVARDVLVAEGVPRSRILVEDASTSTEENARFAKERFGGRRVLVVTDDYHVLRSTLVFHKYFEDTHVVGSSSALRNVRLHGALREVFAISAYAVLGRLSLAEPPHGDLAAADAPSLLRRERSLDDDALFERERWQTHLAESSRDVIVRWTRPRWPCPTAIRRPLSYAARSASRRASPSTPSGPISHDA